jgi:hypothetical protein
MSSRGLAGGKLAWNRGGVKAPVRGFLAGTAGAVEPDCVLVTMVFTDLAGEGTRGRDWR